MPSAEFIKLRAPRTLREMRSNDDAKAQGVRVRGKRSERNLPDTYSDIHVMQPKSWKHRRKVRHLRKSDET